MDANEKTFRHSFLKTVPMFIIVLFLGFLAVSIDQIDTLLFGIAGVAFVVVLLYAISHVKISNEEIITSGLLGSKSLRWSDIARVSMRGQALRLHNLDEDLILSIDPRLDGYKEIVDIVFRKRPDLLDRNEQTVMSSSGLWNLFAVALGIGMIAISILLVFVFKDVDRIVVLIFFAAGTFVVVNWFLSPKRLELEGKNLILGYLLKEVFYSAEDIDSITLERSSTRSGYIYFVQIKLKSGKKIRPPVSQQASALTYQILKRWYEKSCNVTRAMS